LGGGLPGVRAGAERAEAGAVKARGSGGAIRVAPFTVARIDEVLAIEKASFSDPWSREMFRSELEVGGGTYARIAERGKTLVGYLLAVMIIDEAHLGNLAVVPSDGGREWASGSSMISWKRPAKRGSHASRWR